MKEIIEQLNNLQVGDLIWWQGKADEQPHIGIVTKLAADIKSGDYLWRADFPQDGEYCLWGESTYVHALEGMLVAICK